MTETNHPARRLRHGDPPTEPLTFEDDAANKAAEEGELADEGFLYGYFRKNGKHFDMLKGRPNVHTLNSGWVPLYTTKEAADRTARQVANKAEVEPSSGSAAIWDAITRLERTDSTQDERFAAADGLRRLATPPATTGASTVPRPTDDELWDATIRDRDTYHEWADNLAYAIAVHFDVDIGEHSNQNLPWAEALEVIENAERVGASTVLTDERILKIARECAIDEVTDERRPDMATIIDFAREVAAQDGQVAVPGWISVDDRLPELQKEVLICCGYLVLGYRTDDKHDPENHNGWVIDFDNGMASPITHWMPLPAAPSPAKESK